MEIKNTVRHSINGMRILTTIMRTFILLFCATAFSLNSKPVLSQTKIDIERNQEVSIHDAFKTITKQSNFTFLYPDGLFEETRKVKLKKGTIDLNQLLTYILSSGNFDFEILDNNILIKNTVSVNETSNNFHQGFRVNGTVVDSYGQPLPGVNIIQKGTNNGTVSDFDGNYQLEISESDVILVFSYVGFQTVEENVSARRTINITLKESVNNLEEVVLVGYGSSTKKDLTGSVGSVSAKELQDIQFPSVTQALQGRVAGVQITESSGEPGAAISINIRGTNTLGSDTDPLYVIDGIPLSYGGEAEAEEFATSSNPLASLNPNDIQSVEILKDASAASIYGSRASNGVILITTKKGAAGGLSINLSARTYVQDYRIEDPLMNGIQIATARNEQAALNYPTLTFQELIDQELIPYRGQSSLRPLPSNASIGTDWYRSVLSQSIGQNYQFGISGGSDNVRHNFSANYDDQEGTIINSNFKRYNLRYNMDYELNKNLTLTTTTRFNTVRNERAQTGTRTATRGVINWARRLDPNIPLRNDLGEITDTDDEGNFLVNPYVEATDIEDVTKNVDWTFASKLLWNISSNLNWNLNFGYDQRKSDRYSFYPFSTTVGRNANGQYTGSKLEHKHYTAETFFDYNNTINKHQLNFVAGVSFENFDTFREQGRINNFTFDDLQINALQLGQSRVFTNTYKVVNTLQSAFSRMNYNFDDKYLVTLSGRMDGSSKFSEGNKWSLFPSVAVAWNMHNEKFLNSDFIDQLKLRYSLGQTGNQAIDPYATLSEFAIGGTVFTDGIFYTNTYPANIANLDLKWSTTTQSNFGIDLGFANGLFGLTADYYIKKTEDLLLNQQIAPTTGFSSIATNLGSLENEGFEINLRVAVIDKKQFSWGSDINFSTNKTTITSLGDNEFIQGSNISANFLSFPANRTSVGSEPGLFYGWVVDGLIQPGDLNDYENGDLTIRNDGDGNPVFVADNGDPTPGHWKYVDQLTIDTDGDGILDTADGVINDDDRQIIGNPNPDFIFGWNNEFRIGQRFSATLFFQGSYGNDILNASGIYTNFGFDTYNSTQEWYNKRWTLNNQHNNPQYPSGVITVRPTNISVEDGSFIRLKNVVMRYSIPIAEKLKISRLELVLSATNLFTLTNYSGADPEVSTFGTSPLQNGVDYNAYPRSSNYSLGLNLKF